MVILHFEVHIMGLSFHYRGRLKRAKLLPDLVDEVEDICDILGWKTEVFNHQFPENRFLKRFDNQDYGIIFHPPECDPIVLVFDSRGEIYVPWLKDILNKNQNGQIKVITLQLDLTDDGLEPIVSERKEDFDPKKIVYQVHVKTHGESAETHIKVIELVRYISTKYFKDFELFDESQYFETGDVALLDKKINVINEFLDSFQELLNQSKVESPKDFLRLLRKITKMAKNKPEDDEIKE